MSRVSDAKDDKVIRKYLNSVKSEFPNLTPRNTTSQIVLNFQKVGLQILQYWTMIKAPSKSSRVGRNMFQCFLIISMSQAMS